MTMTGTGLPIALIGVLMALWLVGAIVAIWIGLSLRNKSRKILVQMSRLRRLLEAAPAFPVVVKGDGRIEAPDRFSRLLDPKRITQAVGQVLDNAIRYNESGGQVLMVARWQGDALELVVSDNGPGMRETDVLRVSSDNAVPKRLDSNGSITQGLGLPLARQIIETHGGTLQLHCAPGKGTTVIMVLPRP
ncbi:sensor histidine kinase [Sphingorhabdus sp.]|jgi:signal transduction histidine kinase|uniref:sensor histidine kinase n=1 Tax=Sphingorhabdus sp. TaxID=1902408 RepID=UPI0037CB3816